MTWHIETIDKLQGNQGRLSGPYRLIHQEFHPRSSTLSQPQYVFVLEEPGRGGRYLLRVTLTKGALDELVRKLGDERAAVLV